MSDEQQNAPIDGELRIPSPQAPQGSLVPIAGAVAKQIGSGEHAQNSIVYKTIAWSFVAGGLLSAAAVCIAVYESKPNPLEEVKEIWAIFVPMITLALGYVFGKGK